MTFAFQAFLLAATPEQAAMAVAEQAAHRLNMPFLVVDVARTLGGDWIVIEVNDAQESGYAGIAPMAL